MIFFHDRFKQLRLNLKWSQIDIAKECKVTRHAVRFWEKGEHIPSERYVRKLADILNISVSEISNLQDFRKTNNELNNNIKAFNNLLQTTFTERKTDHLAFIDVLNKKFIEQENIFIILKAIINSFDTAIYVKDVNNKYLLGNKAFIKMLNLDECYNLISKVDKDLLSIREATNNSIEDEEVLSGRLTINKDERAILGTKKKKSGLVSKKSIINNNNEIIGMVCSITDITIQRFKKKALFFLIEKIQSRFNIMYVVFDKKGKFVYTNRGLCYNIFGIPEDIPGVFTSCILKKINSDADFFAVELNKELYNTFKQKHPAVKIYNENAVSLKTLVKQEEMGGVDTIICGLPWAAFPASLQDKLMHAIIEVLNPNGYFTTFAYLQGLLLPAGIRFKQTLKENFSSVTTSRTEWRNFPPALVYRCQK